MVDLGAQVPRKVVGWGSLVAAIIALKLAAMTGHAVSVHSGDAVIVRFNPASIAFSALACIAIGVCAFVVATSKIGLLRIGALAPAAMAVLLMVVCIDTVRSRVTITATYVEVPQMGLWNRPHAQFKYDELVGVIHDPNAREVKFVGKAGAPITVPRGDLTTAALPAIADALRQHEVQFVELDSAPGAKD